MLQEQAGGGSSLLRELYSQQRSLAIEFRLMQLDKFYHTFATELETEFEHQVFVIGQSCAVSENRNSIMSPFVSIKQFLT